MKKFTVKNALNGFTLSSDEGELLYQSSDDDTDEVDRFAEFLWAVNEHYGPTTSRYSAKRVRISIEPGDKYEEPVK